MKYANFLTAIDAVLPIKLHGFGWVVYGRNESFASVKIYNSLRKMIVWKWGRSLSFAIAGRLSQYRENKLLRSKILPYSTQRLFGGQADSNGA
jgi:hypothetical protein